MERFKFVRPDIQRIDSGTFGTSKFLPSEHEYTCGNSPRPIRSAVVGTARAFRWRMEGFLRILRILLDFDRMIISTFDDRK